MLTKKAKEYAVPLRPLFDSPMMMMMMMMMTIMVMVLIMMMMILGLIQAYMSFASARTSNACGMLVTQISPSRPLPTKLDVLTRCVRSSLAVASHTVVLRGLGEELIRVP